MSAKPYSASDNRIPSRHRALATRIFFAIQKPSSSILSVQSALTADKQDPKFPYLSILISGRGAAKGLGYKPCKRLGRGFFNRPLRTRRVPATRDKPGPTSRKHPVQRLGVFRTGKRSADTVAGPGRTLALSSTVASDSPRIQLASVTVYRDSSRYSSTLRNISWPPCPRVGPAAGPRARRPPGAGHSKLLSDASESRTVTARSGSP